MALTTYQDALEELVAFAGGTSFTRNQEDCQQAVADALTHVYQERRWTYYRSTWGFTTNAEQTGDIKYYTHDGGRILALSGSTFPSWANAGSVVLDSVIGDIDRVRATTQAVMDADLNFGQAVAAATSYILFRDHFTLPEGFQNVDVTVESATGTILRYLSPADFLRVKTRNASTGEPTAFTILSDPDHTGRYSLFLYPAPQSALTYRMHFHRAFRPLRLTGAETASTTGTVSISSGDDDVTGVSTSFSSSVHPGAVMRLSSSTTAPTRLVGSNPYTEQHVIESVSSTTACRLRTTTAQAFSGVAMVISDPIDIPLGLQKAFRLRCRLELCNARPDTKAKDAGHMQGAYEEAIEAAKSDDGKNDSPRVTGGSPTRWDLGDNPAGEDDE